MKEELVANDSTNSLGTELPKELERVQKIIPRYKECGPLAQFAIMCMEESLRKASVAMISGDLVEMLRSFHDLKSYKE